MHIYRLKVGLNAIYNTPAIHHAHFKKRIRSLDLMVSILWPSEKYRPKSENHQLQIDDNRIVVHNHLHTWRQTNGHSRAQTLQKNIWHANIAHYLHFKKRIRSFGLFVQIWWPSEYLRQNRKKCHFNQSAIGDFLPWV
jgi:hypothetical protein